MSHLPALAPQDPVRRHALVISALAFCSHALARSPSPVAASNPGHLPGYLKGLQLVDHRGRSFGPRRLLGQPTLLNVVYTQCSTVCPVQTRALVELRAQLSPQVRSRLQIVSLSVDPLSDTPASLSAFARRLGADQPGWHWVTGRPEHIWQLADALVLFPPRPRPGQPAEDPRLSAFRKHQPRAQTANLEDHATALWLLDDRGDVRQRYTGHPVDVRRMSDEINALVGLRQAALPAPR